MYVFTVEGKEHETESENDFGFRRDEEKRKKRCLILYTLQSRAAAAE